MKRWLLSLTALFIFGLFLLPGTAGAVRVDDPQRLAVEAGASFAIDDEGGLWAWGSNTYGRLGQTYTTSSMDDYNFYHRDRYTPTKILDDVIWVACGENFGAAIKSDHTLWMWGDNTVGQLGNGGRSNRSYDYGGPLHYFRRYQDSPIQVMGDVAAISCHGQSAAVIKLDGSLWTWGDNRWNQLGNGGKGYAPDWRRYKVNPNKIMDDVMAVSMGDNGGAAVKTDGTLWTWGNCYGGQLGNGTLDDGSDVPIQVGEGYRDVAFGNACLAVKEDNSLWGWGDVTSGGLAGNIDIFDRRNGRDRYQTTPIKLMGDVDKAYTADGYNADGYLRNAAAAIKTDGSLWVWGGAATGTLGISQTKPESDRIYQPVKLLDNVSHLALSDHALALDQSGVLRAWGHSTLKEVYNPVSGLIGKDVQSSDEDWQSPVVIPTALLDLSGQAAPSEEDPQPGAGEGLPPDDPGAPDIVTTGIDPQEAGVAQSVRQPLEVQDERAELAGYALSDGAGGSTTYVRLRDLAWLLNGTAAQFDVGYDGAIALTSNAPYSSPNGTEGSAPFQGAQPYIRWDGLTLVDGREVALRAFVLTDTEGGGHTYYKLRDLGQALGFNVGWSVRRGMYVEPGRPYSDED